MSFTHPSRLGSQVVRLVIGLLWLMLPTSVFAEELGTYIVNGVTFKIPKAALLTKQPEGENDGITILLKWPELTPAKWEGNQSAVIKVGIEKNVDHTGQIDGLSGPLDSSDIVYHSSASWLTVRNGRKMIVDPAPVLLMKNTKYGTLDYYKLPRLGHVNVVDKDFFIKGDPLKPDYWYACQLGRCYTAIRLDDKIYLKISHHQVGFITQGIWREIIDETTARVKSYIK